MLSYCLKCRKKRESRNPCVTKKNNEKIMPLSKCAMYNSKKSRFIKQEINGLLIRLGLKTCSSKIPLVGDILF